MKRWTLLLAIALVPGCGKSDDAPAAKPSKPGAAKIEKQFVSPFKRYEKKYVRITFKDTLSVEVRLLRAEPELLYVEADGDNFCVKPDVVAKIEPATPDL
jgi:hypothetical protein